MNEIPPNLAADLAKDIYRLIDKGTTIDKAIEAINRTGAGVLKYQPQTSPMLALMAQASLNVKRLWVLWVYRRLKVKNDAFCASYFIRNLNFYLTIILA